MAVRGILFLTLFIGMCVAQSKAGYVAPSCPCSCTTKILALETAAAQPPTSEPPTPPVEDKDSTNETKEGVVVRANDQSTYICAPKNLALGAPTAQSTTNSNLGSANAVDGNKNPTMKVNACSQTNEEINSWWRVDLKAPYNINRVVITNRGDGSAEKINDAQIHIGNSLSNNGNSNQLATVVDSIELGETKTFDFTAISGRYVNINIPTRNEVLTLCEVEVFAD